jgi:hypothetical protein
MALMSESQCFFYHWPSRRFDPTAFSDASIGQFEPNLGFLSAGNDILFDKAPFLTVELCLMRRKATVVWDGNCLALAVSFTIVTAETVPSVGQGILSDHVGVERLVIQVRRGTQPVKIQYKAYHTNSLSNGRPTPTSTPGRHRHPRGRDVRCRGR